MGGVVMTFMLMCPRFPPFSVFFFGTQYGVLTPVENVSFLEETVGKAPNSSPQSVSKKILARRKAAKERNSKVCLSHFFVALP